MLLDKCMEETTNPTNTNTCQHDGNENFVTSGVVRCGQCFEDMDDSGHRPGLVESNQWR